MGGAGGAAARGFRFFFTDFTGNELTNPWSAHSSDGSNELMSSSISVSSSSWSIRGKCSVMISTTRSRFTELSLLIARPSAFFSSSVMSRVSSRSSEGPNCT